jgi:NAD(P)H-nitrite reductase large subunit
MVDRCVCYEKTFSEMKALIDAKRLNTIEELKKYMVFGENCKICIPYVQMIFKTGKTSFDVIPFMGGNTEGI